MTTHSKQKRNNNTLKNTNLRQHRTCANTIPAPAPYQQRISPRGATDKQLVPLPNPRTPMQQHAAETLAQINFDDL
jgi:hypothetical protein